MSDTEFDYENDWAGEARNDPDDGNTYVLRRILWDEHGSGLLGDHYVRANDIFGGHDRKIPIHEWVKWERNDG